VKTQRPHKAGDDGNEYEFTLAASYRQKKPVSKVKKARVRSGLHEKWWCVMAGSFGSLGRLFLRKLSQARRIPLNALQVRFQVCFVGLCFFAPNASRLLGI
jgi:hypothetical protein